MALAPTPTPTPAPAPAAGSGGAPPASMFDEEKALKELKGEAPAPEPVDTANLTEEAKAEVEAGKAMQGKYEAAAQADLAKREAAAKAAAEKALEDAKKALEEAKSRSDEVGIVVAMESIRENMRLLETAKVKGPVNYTSDIRSVEKEGAKAYIESELTPDPVIVDQVRFSQVEALRSRDKKLGTVPVGVSTNPPASTT